MRKHGEIGALANESKSGRSTGLILMPFSMNVRTYVVSFVCKFRQFWLGGRYLELVLKAEKSPTDMVVKSVQLDKF